MNDLNIINMGIGASTPKRAIYYNHLVIVPSPQKNKNIFNNSYNILLDVEASITFLNQGDKNMKTKICSKCNKELSLDNFKKHRAQCNICRQQYEKEWHLKNKNRRRKEERTRYHAKKNGTFISKRAPHNKQARLEYRRKYEKERLLKDPQYKLAKILRNRLLRILQTKTINKTFQSHIKFLGCNLQYCKIYIENQFKNGMSWSNHGDWHIDHIKPLNSFDLTDKQQIKKACHYTNLQPLWAEENIKKGNNIPARGYNRMFKPPLPPSPPKPKYPPPPSKMYG